MPSNFYLHFEAVCLAFLHVLYHGILRTLRDEVDELCGRTRSSLRRRGVRGEFQRPPGCAQDLDPSPPPPLRMLN
jgi:hypothetical protein